MPLPATTAQCLMAFCWEHGSWLSLLVMGYKINLDHCIMAPHSLCCFWISVWASIRTFCIDDRKKRTCECFKLLVVWYQIVSVGNAKWNQHSLRKQTVRLLHGVPAGQTSSHQGGMWKVLVVVKFFTSLLENRATAELACRNVVLISLGNS